MRIFCCIDAGVKPAQKWIILAKKREGNGVPRAKRSRSDMPFPCFKSPICELDTRYFHGERT